LGRKTTYKIIVDLAHYDAQPIRTVREVFNIIKE